MNQQSEHPVPEPFNWNDVAIVAFEKERPVIITSAEPVVMIDTMLGLLEDRGEDPEDYFVSEELQDLLDRVRAEIRNYRWSLYQTEDAKRVFCSRPQPDERQKTMAFAD